jgi:hypothetical protein
LVVGVPKVENEILTFDPAAFAQTLAERIVSLVGLWIWRTWHEDTHSGGSHPLLRLGGERRSEEAESDSADERAAVHYSMT